ncbi:PTS system fructose subfamily IIA component [Denitrovibrio acetiphilus DSM 12809]|uniref:PTS system fructose subfamily IIA component n=1 Tax=Denitrovibrio acetiphilus (strain DSM 12809 / NBRC 114555 / N2460) TaxID=522772 RepID=D4H7T7_DENA2|nr:PTS sugar transporter subunit IIA [Denitrovibrio acetiphilus]ADD68086.1 PTS system fructose subfamily IIA component [Denitrovibrio acetiphilus DSM 12809]
MIGLILVTHGSFGSELIKTAEMIVGKQDSIETISMQEGASLSSIADEIESSIEKYSTSGAIVFTDMFGGSPSNISMAYLGSKNVEVVSGVNLPMLIKAISVRKENKSLSAICEDCAESGKASIIVAGQLLKGN